MAIFNNEKTIATDIKNLRPVCDVVRDSYMAKGYVVKVEECALGYFISLSSGGIFKKVLGLQTALNIELNKTEGAIIIKASVGIFGQQVIPTLIMLFVAWPVLLTQIWGLVKQSKLDDEALSLIENTIHDCEKHENERFNSTGFAEYIFCPHCGYRLPANTRKCTRCGESTVE